MKRVSLYILTFFAALMLVALSFVLLVNTIGMGFCEEDFVIPLRTVKEYIAQNSISPRIVVFSGSNASYSIDEDILESMVGLPVVDYALIYTEPIRYYLSDLERVLREGDILYLPLELQHYTRTTEDSLYNSFAASWLFSANHDVLRHLTAYEIVNFYSRYGVGWIDASIQKPREKRFVYSPEEAGEMWKKGFYPSFKRLKKSGGLYLDAPTTIDYNRGAVKEFPCFLSEEFRSSFEKIKAIAKKKKVRVVVGYPPLMYYTKAKGLANFREIQESLGVELCGRPEALYLPRSYFTNSYYHPNREGARILSYEVAKSLCRLLGKPIEEAELPDQFVFAEHQASLTANGLIRPYLTGCRVDGDALEFSLPLPSNCRNGEVFVEIMLDRGIERAEKVIQNVYCSNVPLLFEEVVDKEKNLLRFWPNARNLEKLDIKIIASNGVGYERAMLEPSPKSFLKRTRTLNSIGPCFEQFGPERRHFRYLGGDGKEAYLRVWVPNYGSNRYSVKMSFTAPERVLSAACPCGVLWRDESYKHITGDSMSLNIPINASSMFVYKGHAFVGLVVDVGKLQVGDVIELTDLQFLFE